MEKTYLLPVMYIATAIINYILCYFFISKFGLFGAAVARFITLAILATIMTVWTKRYITFCISWSLVIKSFLASAAMGFSILWLPNETWSQLFMTVAAGLIIFLIFLTILRVVEIDKCKNLKNEVLGKL